MSRIQIDNKDIIIYLDKISKEYKSGYAVRDVSLSIKKGGIYGLVGPNGAGKTTIMRMMGGLIFPTKGHIHMFENGIAIKNDEARKKMSFIIEYPYLNMDMTAKGNLEKFRILYGIKDKNIIEETLKMVGLSDVDRKKPVKKYSLGMRQRLGIAVALLNKPDVLVLDEPINGLDPEGIIEIREFLLKLNRENNTTILISSHILSELSLLCTDFLFITNGQIIKEISRDELKKECGENLKIQTDNDELAMQVINDNFENLTVENNGEFIIVSGFDNIRDISKTLSDNSVIPTHLSTETANLEEYYISLIENWVEPDIPKSPIDKLLKMLEISEEELSELEEVSEELNEKDSKNEAGN